MSCSFRPRHRGRIEAGRVLVYPWREPYQPNMSFLCRNAPEVALPDDAFEGRVAEEVETEGDVDLNQYKPCGLSLEGPSAPSD